MKRFHPHEAQGTGEQCGMQMYNLLESRRKNRRKSLGKRRGSQLLAVRLCLQIGGLYALAASYYENRFHIVTSVSAMSQLPIIPLGQSVQSGTTDPRRLGSARSALVGDEEPFPFRFLEHSMCRARTAYHQGEPAREPGGTGRRKQEPQARKSSLDPYYSNEQHVYYDFGHPPTHPKPF